MLLFGFVGILVGLLSVALAFREDVAGKGKLKFIEFFRKRADCLLLSILCGMGFTMLFSHLGFGVELLAACFLITMLAFAAAFDIKSQRISDKAALLCLLSSLLLVFASNGTTLRSGILGGLCSGGILLLLSLATKGGVGMGDAKLFAAAGIGLGLGGSLSALVIAALTSGIYGLFLVLLNMKNRKRVIPFAPFILLSIVIVLIS